MLSPSNCSQPPAFIPASHLLKTEESTFILFAVLLTNKSDGVAWMWIEPIMSYTFGSLWVIPLFWLSKILNSLWFLVSKNFLSNIIPT